MPPRKKLSDGGADAPSERPSSVRRFRKKSFEVETILWTGDNLDEVIAWGGDIPGKHNEPAVLHSRFWDGTIQLSVFNNQEVATIPVPVGHRIVRGALGELYPISPAALDATFDPAA